MDIHTKVRVTIDLDPNGVQKTKTKISALTIEDRDEAQARLRNGLPWLEMFESTLRKSSEPEQKPEQK